MKRFQRINLALFALACALIVAACGGDEEPTPAAPAAADTPAAASQPAAAATDTPAPAAAAQSSSNTAAVTDTASITESAAVTSSEATSDTGAAAGTGKAAALEPTARNGMYSEPPAMTIDPKKFYYATFKTAKGDIKVQLFADRVPTTVNNFVFLAREGFYDSTTFHRVLDQFMAQGGDPTGTGSGGPGYEFADEFLSDLNFDRPGLLAMANSGPATNGSQFFLTLVATDWLNQRHTIFGEVIEGKEVLDKLTRRDPSANPTEPGDLLNTVVIEESDTSVLPPPPPTPTPFPPSSLDASTRPLAQMPAAEKANHFNTAPEMKIEAGKVYTAALVTSRGALTVELRGDLAPIAVNNFVILADLGFYDNVPINAIQPGEFVMFGSPDNLPSSDAGYKLLPEANLPVELQTGMVGYIPRERSDQGIVSSSSQLFIAIQPPPADQVAFFSLFGKIVGGADLLPQLTMSDTIQSITVLK